MDDLDEIRHHNRVAMMFSMLGAYLVALAALYLGRYEMFGAWIGATIWCVCGMIKGT